MTLSCISVSSSIFPLSTLFPHERSILALVIPAAYHSAKAHSGNLDNATDLGLSTGTYFLDSSFDAVVDGTDLESPYESGLRIISRGTAILLLIVYIAYLYFQVRSSRYDF